MYLSSIKNKIDCCYANSIYEEYLEKRYGIENCKKSEWIEIDNLEILHKTYNYFYKSTFYNTDNQLNTGITNIEYEDCNISKLIEKINII